MRRTGNLLSTAVAAAVVAAVVGTATFRAVGIWPPCGVAALIVGAAITLVTAAPAAAGVVVIETDGSSSTD